MLRMLRKTVPSVLNATQAQYISIIEHDHLGRLIKIAPTLGYAIIAEKKPFSLNSLIKKRAKTMGFWRFAQIATIAII
jgi:hypothetical protein